MYTNSVEMKADVLVESSILKVNYPCWQKDVNVNAPAVSASKFRVRPTLSLHTVFFSLYLYNTNTASLNTSLRIKCIYAAARTASIPMEDLLRYTPSRAAVLTVSPFLSQKFFKRNPGLTEQICVQQAAQVLGRPASSILPTAIQGASSFTVTRSDARPGDLGVVQFRDLSSPLNRDTVALARRTYGHVIPACDAVTCGLSDKAHVYLMTLAGGIAFSAAQRTLYQDEGAERLTVTVADFASSVLPSPLSPVTSPACT